MTQLPDFSAHGYRALSILGANPEGGRVAYRAAKMDDGAEVVIKRFSFADTGASWDSYTHHQRELAMLESLDHPRIPRYLGDFQAPDGFCLVQAFCPAPSMATQKIWGPQKILAIARSALEVLAFLQEHTPPVIHRDIKPENLLVDEEGNVHLVDFGLARADRAQATTLAVGTPGYMPPEQLLGHELTTGTDLYGLGATLFTALTGTPSNQIGSLVDATFSFDMSRLPGNLSGPFRQWLGRMVAPDQRHRFPSAQAALTALAQVKSVTGQTQEQTGKPHGKKRGKKPKKRKDNTEAKGNAPRKQPVNVPTARPPREPRGEVTQGDPRPPTLSQRLGRWLIPALILAVSTGALALLELKCDTSGTATSPETHTVHDSGAAGHKALLDVLADELRETTTAPGTSTSHEFSDTPLADEDFGPDPFDQRNKRWIAAACGPVHDCLQKTDHLGEYVADLRVTIHTDGSLGHPDFLRKKLPPALERCISASIPRGSVENVTGQTHVVRCTETGNRMAGGGGISSSSSGLEP